MFSDIFNTLVDVVTIPVKLTAKIVDDVTDSEIENYVEELKDTVKLPNQ
jgi:hypothetical protein